MKTYFPQTDHYRDLLSACRDELRLLGYRPGTARLSGVGEFLAWLEGTGVGLAEVVRADVEYYLEGLRERPSRRGGTLSDYTVAGYVFSLRLLFDYCERHGLRGGSPLAGLRLPTPAKVARYVVTSAEVTRLYAAAGEDARATAILHLLYGCGLRRTETEGLDVGDVRTRSGLLHVRSGKGRKRRTVPLSATVAAGLRDYLTGWRVERVGAASGNAFLLDDRGRRMRGATVSRRLREVVVRAGVSRRVTPHVLRHGIATHLLAGGMRLERVRDFLGHARLETTQLYTHLPESTGTPQSLPTPTP